MKRPMPPFTIHLGGDFSEARVVPVSPTPEMLEAACKALDGVDLSGMTKKDKAQVKMAIRWQAMLKAAPTLRQIEKKGWWREVPEVSDRRSA